MATAGSSSSKRANELIPKNIGVDHPKAAVVAIDLHRGHLDMAVATMPTSPEVAARVIAANKRLFDWCRSVDIPIVHQVTSYRDADAIRANPFWRTRAEDPTATRKNVMRHNIIGGPGCTVIPQLLDPRDFVVNTKKTIQLFPRHRSRFHAALARHQHASD